VSAHAAPPSVAAAPPSSGGLTAAPANPDAVVCRSARHNFSRAEFFRFNSFTMPSCCLLTTSAAFTFSYRFFHPAFSLTSLLISFLDDSISFLYDSNADELSLSAYWRWCTGCVVSAWATLCGSDMVIAPQPQSLPNQDLWNTTHRH
jgi:hypothetical protein